MSVGTLDRPATRKSRKVRNEEHFRMNWDLIRFHVSNWHNDQRRIDGSAYSGHLHEVATYCGKFVRKYYRDTHGFVTPGSNEQIDAMIAAGYLHEAIYHAGRSFEDICDIASIETAKIVADASPDVRLPRAPRMLHFQSRVGASNAFVQLVVLCDMYVTIGELLQLPNGRQLRDSIDLIEGFVADYQGILDTLNHLRHCAEIGKALFRPTAARFTALLALLESLKARYHAP